jgi:hypothetical protein
VFIVPPAGATVIVCVYAWVAEAPSMSVALITKLYVVLELGLVTVPVRAEFPDVGSTAPAVRVPDSKV